MAGQLDHVLCYYFPNYHIDKRNEYWHGQGWTEWDLVKNARPRFAGHRQPIEPAWGHFDESDPKWAAKEIDLAADHGITGFIFDWYWYEDGPYLHEALLNGFLKAPNNNRLTFSLMWANHDWLNIHPASAMVHKCKQEPLAKGQISREAFDRMTDLIVKDLFSRPNYLKINGCPYFSIYEIGKFVAGYGSLEGAVEVINSFRAKTKAAGFPDLHLDICIWGFNVLPGEMSVRDPVAVAKALGCASVGSYVWIHHHNITKDGFPEASYEKCHAANQNVWREKTATFPVPYYPNVTMGWDSSPRTCQTDKFENRGYPFMSIMAGNTPAAFEHALRTAVAFLQPRKSPDRILLLNAWNEWTEGSYLLPDTVTGTAYLEAIKRVCT